VLFVEKGLFFHGEFHLQNDGSAKLDESLLAQLANPTSENPEARLRTGWWPLRLQGRTTFGEHEFFAPLGCGSGGSTSLYAAALERLSPADFRPRANFPDVNDSTLPEKWPITYEDLRPFYTQAEELFRVRGTPDPLGQGGGILRKPPDLSPRDQHLFDSFGRLGLHPYRVHVGYEYVDGCEECGGLCPRGCKNDSGWICLLPALEKYGASILPQCEVLKLEAGSSEVREIRCRRNAKEFSIRAKIVVLAAGAFMTPVLLLNSKSEGWRNGLANRSGLVGRNLMLHAGDFIAVKPAKRLSTTGPLKCMALNDLYNSEGEKLGTFQAAGRAVSPGRIMQYMRDVAEKDPSWWKKLASPTPVWWRKLSSPAVRLIALAAYYYFKNAPVWASIIEDLPYHDNRVISDPQANNGMRFEYRYPEELKKRVLSFRRRLTKALGPHKMFVLSGENNLNFGHVCGTCRFGDDPATSVLDKNNRAHDVANLYVVDASFFPSSGGTNPSLTIAANSLRVAEVIHKQLG
jgi:choline dehydrogenase-like flavoprotein